MSSLHVIEDRISYKVYRVRMENSRLSYDIKRTPAGKYYYRERVNGTLCRSKWVRTRKRDLIKKGILSEDTRL